MQIKETYFCKYSDDKAIWFAPNAEIPEGYTIIETRKMIFPDEGKCLKNKETEQITYGRWIKDETEIEKWEDAEIPVEIDESEVMYLPEHSITNEIQTSN